MVSLPPTPQRAPEQRPMPDGGASSSTSMPEAVRLMLACWAVMIGGELIHQILTVVMTVLDPAPLRESAKEAAKGQDLSDAMLNLGIYGSLVLMALIQLLILAGFAVALRMVANRGKRAAAARRLLQIFATFFALRMVTLYMMSPGSTAVPIALYGADGVVQIILGVAGAMGLFYASQKDSGDWVEPPAHQSPQQPQHDDPAGKQ
ncbi:hypothetical protein [Corynebacterium hadale]|uniref:hypothetical protein n=1 Tax=Corynebacterium hadale TaxID=2026255 RepID=UPI0010548B69|nr:hypothetical protein [Corynebacterium hadale]